ncbi:hypothetical protein Kpol_311p5 [Vanderwaltozyma polyspora DSM 70294]|uniref:SET domain-containing protein n=1 Tax=Vanderwaltozyma polyspora (strain ATCC 22028 / DSM 70294 / BCRC 21397 / CBS 2163 / NBRC 10782 / NRRL Y-8283 / UCD 57-17) TaxID=436907 RepID=A7TSP1_VANPO|nr:uncharacterized protein Kpol_311p5 [Vanderwaltozyma polyspora DSM 70294]EDO14720.1 hypothetical protein Kpol_311p5 [Vanderwaltozyma polyspora DSM 70294]
MISNQDLDNFIKWSKENGAVIDERIDFRVTKSTGISCFSNSIISKQEDSLISVPSDLIINRKLAEKYMGVTSKDLKLSTKNPNSLTILFFSSLKFNGSFGNGIRNKFLPYLNIIPIELDQPYFWDPKIIEVIEGTDLFLIMKNNLIEIFNEWEELMDKLELSTDDPILGSSINEKILFEYVWNFRNHGNNEIQWNSFYAYLWASCIFSSRAFPELIIDTDTSSDINTAFLFPVVDLLNHKNDTNVRWNYRDGNISFNALDTIRENEEVFNNYGDKTNEELLLSYGFAYENNVHDTSRLTLRLDPTLIASALGDRVKLSKREYPKPDTVEFELSMNVDIPNNLINFFGYLCKLQSEKTTTIRSILEGCDQLLSIFNQKLIMFKGLLKFDQSKLNNYNTSTLKQVKIYLTSQRRIFNFNIESLQKLQKKILKSSEENISFKSIFKSDKTFANSMLINRGIINYEDLVKKDAIREALLLWVVRISNHEAYPKKFDFSFPKFIIDMFLEISENKIIEKEDVEEFIPYYKELFPKLSEKIPEVYNIGKWGIRQFIIADTVLDRLTWIKIPPNESFFIKRQEFKL